MKSLSVLPLDDDVIDLILAFSLDFEALQATILASKTILYSVFKTHPNAIVKAVAYNMVRDLFSFSERKDVAWWQTLWTPIQWGNLFDGCCLDRPTSMWVKDLVDDNGETVWVEEETWSAEVVEEENSFPKGTGRLLLSQFFSIIIS
ncbi:hypothetical protein C8J57DRAFT_1464703 [Mycena rebaudengoi]|nr:hypothetical protein C8J57DRAFT_1464703 [Mycena rebaudengoi]